MNYTDLDLNLLKTFLVVYETKSILNASKKLYISQPAVTASIKRLEQFLGGALFVRTPKGVTPTAEGEQFNNHCYNAMKIIENGILQFTSYASLQMGSLNIGSSSTIIRTLLIPFIVAFNKQYPHIKITVTDANSEKLIRLAKRGEIDVAVLNEPVTDAHLFELTPLITTHDCFIASTDFESNFLSKEQLKTVPLILQKRPSSNRDYFEQMCLNNNIDLQPAHEIGSFGLMTDFVEQGLGIAYTVKEFIERDLKQGRVKVIESDFDILPRQVVVLTTKISINSFACHAFVEKMVQTFADKKAA